MWCREWTILLLILIKWKCKKLSEILKIWINIKFKENTLDYGSKNEQLFPFQLNVGWIFLLYNKTI